MRMERLRTVLRAVSLGVCVLGAAVARAEGPLEPPLAPEAEPPQIFNDTGRLYFDFVTGMNFTLDQHFAGDTEISGEPDFLLGASLGYNTTRHSGAELQVQGGQPHLRSPSPGYPRAGQHITA